MSHAYEARSRSGQYWHQRRQRRREIIAATFPSSHDKNDPRPYATIKIEGRPIAGLLDSGASVSCLGLGAVDFANSLGLKWSKAATSVSTASGQCQSVLGFVDTMVEYGDRCGPQRLFIVPSLSQRLYLGIDFWKSFQIAPALISEIDNRKADDPTTNQPTHDLARGDRLMLDKVIESFPSFAKNGLGQTSLVTHSIDTGNATPIKQRHYPVSPAVQAMMDEELSRMLELGVITESNSPWSSPIVMVKKSNGKIRLCLDVRKVNAVTVKDAYPTPTVEGLLSRLNDTKYISAIDLKDAFWQIPLDEDAKLKTAFAIPGRPLYHFNVMPFGLCNAPQRLCRLMDQVIPHRLRHQVFVYLDDLLVVSADFRTHIDLLSQVAAHLSHAGLTINVEKSKFCLREVKYLGFIVGDGCIRVDPDKVAAIKNYPQPTTVKQLRRFLGMAGWYRRFIANHAAISAPLTDLLQKNKKFLWIPEAQASFDAVKDRLTSAPILTHPDFTKPFVVQCDACTSGIGGVLFQLDDAQQERPIAFISHKLTPAQRNYSITELECLAAVLSVERFRPYIEGHPFTIVTDHASLQWLMTLKELSGRLARWSLRLQAFDFSIEHRRGSLNTVPDALSRVFAEELMEDSVDILLDEGCPDFESADYAKIRESVQTNKDRLPDLMVKENRVYKRITPAIDGDITDTPSWKLWVPDNQQETVIKQAHEPPTAAHCGVRKTTEKIRRCFYWPSMGKMIHNFVTSCEVCKQSKAPNYTLRPPMGSMFEVERPFQRLYVDLIGPYPRSKAGNTMALVVLDQLTKFVLIRPLRKGTSATVISYLRSEVFNVFGVPETLHSDNGTQFVSREFEKFLEEYGVRHTLTAVYTPQSNASERVNRSVLAAVRSYIRGDHREWDVHIHEIAGALRNAVHSSTGFSPHYLTFGFNLIRHGSMYRLLRELKCLSAGDVGILPTDVRLNVLHERVQNNLRKAHGVHTRQYNLRSRDRTFDAGQTVYRRNFALSDRSEGFNAKLAPKFVACKIVKRVGHCHYVIKDIVGNYTNTFHAKDIKT